MQSDLTFSEFVLKQATNAGVFLGQRENPLTGEKVVNLKAAKGTLDVLHMLREKTEGNLTNQEKSLLLDTLTTLDQLYDQTIQLEPNAQ